MSNLQTAKKHVEQLRVECNVQRAPVSETTQQMITYIQQHLEQDHLLIGIDKKQNPFQEKSSCTVLWGRNNMNSTVCPQYLAVTFGTVLTIDAP